jgi:glycosyltransferase involved in cell wall biosynthesis
VAEGCRPRVPRRPYAGVSGSLAPQAHPWPGGSYRVQSMRILLVSYAYPPLLQMGGPPEKVEQIARLLAAHGHRVTVLTARPSPSVRTTVHRESGVEVVRLGSVARHRSSVTVNPDVLRFCFGKLPEFDIVHVFGLYDLIGPVVTWFARRRRVPYVLEPMGMHRPVARSVTKKRAYHLLIGRSVVGGASRVIATSERERQALVEDGLSLARVAVRRDGVDVEAFTRLPSPGGFRGRWRIAASETLVLYLGRLTRVKQPGLLLQAFAALEELSGVLAFVGADEDGQRDSLKDLARRLGVPGRVLFTGPLYGADKLAALVDADVFVLPSSSESFGIAAVEAMACGTPTIVTDQCGVAPYVAAGAGLVIPASVDGLRASLARILNEPALRRRCAEQGPNTAHSLSWEEPVGIMEEMYRQIAEDRISPP